MLLNKDELLLIAKALKDSGATSLSERFSKLAIAAHTQPYTLIPTEPTATLLNSMGMRYRHDWGLTKEADSDDLITCGLTEAERDSLRITMRQLHEEVVGTGFYRPESS